MEGVGGGVAAAARPYICQIRAGARQPNVNHIYIFQLLGPLIFISASEAISILSRTEQYLAGRGRRAAPPIYGRALSFAANKDPSDLSFPTISVAKA